MNDAVRYDAEYLVQDKQIRIERMGEFIAPLKSVDPSTHEMLQAMMGGRIKGSKFLENKLAAYNRDLSVLTAEELVQSLKTEVMAGFATAGWTDFAGDAERRRIQNAPTESYSWNMMPLLDYVYSDDFDPVHEEVVSGAANLLLDQAVKERNVVKNLRGCRRAWRSLNANNGSGSTLQGEADKEVEMTEKMHKMITELVQKKAASFD